MLKRDTECTAILPHHAQMPANNAPSTPKSVLSVLLLSGLMLSSFLLWFHANDPRAHYTRDLMLRGQVPRNYTQITAAAADAANSLASAFSTASYYSVATTATSTTATKKKRRRKKLTPREYIEYLGLYSYLRPKQQIWNLQPQDPKNLTRPKLVNEEDYPGVYIPMHQNILNEETMEALMTPLTEEEYKEVMEELDRQERERLENKRRGITKPPAVIRTHNDGPGGDGSVRERLVYYAADRVVDSAPKPRIPGGDGSARGRLVHYVGNREVKIAPKRRIVNDTHYDGRCGRYTTTGWHQPVAYTAVLKPTMSPNKKLWRWQECAQQCARRNPDECEYWTLQLEQDRNCLLLVGRGAYTDSGGHVEGDRDLDCLKAKTLEEST